MARPQKENKCICCSIKKSDIGGLVHITFPGTGYFICYHCFERLAGKEFFNINPSIDSDCKHRKDKISHKLRLKIYRRDNYTCQYCGKDSDLSLDHIIPESKGGLTNEVNLITSCLSCNTVKGKKTLKETGMKINGGSL